MPKPSVRQMPWRFSSLSHSVQVVSLMRIRLSPTALTRVGATQEVNMLRQSLAVLTAAVLAGGSTVAFAQGRQGCRAQSDPTPNLGPNQFSQNGMRGQIDGPRRFSERVALRRQLRQTGFRNTRIPGRRLPGAGPHLGGPVGGHDPQPAG